MIFLLYNKIVYICYKTSKNVFQFYRHVIKCKYFLYFKIYIKYKISLRNTGFRVDGRLPASSIGITKTLFFLLSQPFLHSHPLASHTPPIRFLFLLLLLPSHPFNCSMAVQAVPATCLLSADRFLPVPRTIYFPRLSAIYDYILLLASLLPSHPHP